MTTTRSIDGGEAGSRSSRRALVGGPVGNFCTVHDIPATVASCTGARHPSVLGAVLPGRAGFPWGERPAQLPRVLRIAQAAP